MACSIISKGNALLKGTPIHIRSRLFSQSEHRSTMGTSKSTRMLCIHSVSFRICFLKSHKSHADRRWKKNKNTFGRFFTDKLRQYDKYRVCFHSLFMTSIIWKPRRPKICLKYMLCCHRMSIFTFTLHLTLSKTLLFQ